MYEELVYKICENKDYRTALLVLQTLSKVRRAGYVSVTELVQVLAYCSNSFAANDCHEFFEEFAIYMPNIIIEHPENIFSHKSKAYYYFEQRIPELLEQTDIPLDGEIYKYLRTTLVNKNIYKDEQVIPLLKALCSVREMAEVQKICDEFQPQVTLKTGF